MLITLSFFFFFFFFFNDTATTEIYTLSLHDALPICGFGDAEIDHLWHGYAIIDGDENVRRFDIAMNDPLLMSMLDRLTDFHEQVQPLPRREIPFVAEVGDFDAADQFHHEEGAARGDLRFLIFDFRFGSIPLTRPSATLSPS